MTRTIRALGDTERVMWRFSQVASYSFLMVAEVKGPLTEVALTEALRQVQAHHAPLRWRVVDGKTPHFVEGDVPEIPVRWVTRSRSDQWLSEAEAEIDTPFDGARGPLFRVAALSGLGKPHELLFVFHHAIADGLSSHGVIQDLLTALSGAKIESPPTPCDLPPVESLLPRTARGFSGLWRLCLFYLRCIRTLFVRKLVQLPADSASAISGRRMRVVHRRFTQEWSARFLAKCREEGVTVTSAVTAAMLMAVNRNVRQTSSAGPLDLACMQPIDVRPQLEPQLKGELGVYTGATVTPQRMGADVDIWKLAENIQRDVRLGLHRGEALGGFSIQRRMLHPRLSARALADRADSMYRVAVGVTSLGRSRIPVSYGDFTLTSVHGVAAMHGCGTTFGAYLGNFAGEIVLNFLFVDPLVRREVGESLAECVDDVLFGEVPAPEVQGPLVAQSAE